MHRLFALVLLLFVGSCIPSLHPLYTDREEGTVALPELLGTWTFEGPATPLDRSYWKITQGHGNAYLFEILSKGKVAHLEAYVVEIDGEFYLDTYPNKLSVQQQIGEVSFAHFVPVHVIWRLIPEGDGFDLVLMTEGPGSFKDKVVQDESIAPRQMIEDGQSPVLTGSPAQLQKMIQDQDPEKIFGSEATVSLRRPES